MKEAFQIIEWKVLNELNIMKSLIVQLLPPPQQQYVSSHYYQPQTNYQIYPQFNAMPYLSNLQQTVENQQSLTPNIPISVPVAPVLSNNRANGQLATDLVPQNDEANNENTLLLTTVKPIIEKPTSAAPLIKTTRPTTSAATRGQNKINFANFLSSPGMTSPYKLKPRFNNVAPIAMSIPATTEKLFISSTTERILEFRPVQKKSLTNDKSRTIQRLLLPLKRLFALYLVDIPDACVHTNRSNLLATCSQYMRNKSSQVNWDVLHPFA